MKCQAVHSALLGSEKPDRLAADVVAHLQGCGPCRGWQRRLVHLERNVALLPAPSAPKGKAAFIQQFLSAPIETAPVREDVPVETPATVPVDSSTVIQTRKFDRLAAALRSTLNAPRKTLNFVPAPARRRIAAVMAAALFFLAFGLWSTSPTGVFAKRPADPLLAQVMKHDVRLAAAQSYRERLDALADLADVLQNDPRELIDAAGPEELATLARCYEKVVREGIVVQAHVWRKEDPAADLDAIAARLLKAAEDAERLARVRPQESAAPLNQIARAARDGESKLPPHGVGAKAMRRASAVPPVLFASSLLADLQGGLSTATRAELLRRNSGLLQNVVQITITLAAANTPLNRATACGDLANCLAEEIRGVQENEADRAIELAEYLKAVLKQGVAANLTAARPAIPSGSNDEQRLYEVQDRTAEAMRALEDFFPAHGDALDDLQLARRAVRDGLTEVEKAVKRVKTGN
jgi:hypothetical protein